MLSLRKTTVLVDNTSKKEESKQASYYNAFLFVELISSVTEQQGTHQCL